MITKKQIKIPNKIMAEAIADDETAQWFVKNPCVGRLFFYFEQHGIKISDWTKTLIKTIENPKEFCKGYTYKKLKKEAYDPFAFNGNCNPDAYAYQIVLATPLVELCDYLKIDIDTDPTPNHWWPACDPDLHFEEDFKQAVLMCSKKDCQNFARLFSKKPEKWFEEENWLDNFI